MYKRARQQFCSWGYILSFFGCFFEACGQFFFFFFSTSTVHTYKINPVCWSQEFCLSLPKLCPTPMTGGARLSPWPGGPRREQKSQRQNVLLGWKSVTLSTAPWPHLWKESSTPAVFYLLWVFCIKPNYLWFPFRMNKYYTLMWTFSPNKWPLNNQKDFYLCNILDFSYVMAVERR